MMKSLSCENLANFLWDDMPECNIPWIARSAWTWRTGVPFSLVKCSLCDSGHTWTSEMASSPVVYMITLSPLLGVWTWKLGMSMIATSLFSRTLIAKVISTDDSSDTIGEDVSSFVIQLHCFLPLVQACPFFLVFTSCWRCPSSAHPFFSCVPQPAHPSSQRTVKVFKNGFKSVKKNVL